MQGEDLQDTYRKRELKNKQEIREPCNPKVQAGAERMQKNRGAPQAERGGVWVAARVRPSWLINTIGMLEKYATLAPVLRQGCIDLGVCLGRGLSSARGASDPEASEMSIYLSTR